MGRVLDSTPLTDDERRYLRAAVYYGADHRDHDGYAPVGSLWDAIAELEPARAVLEAHADELWATAPNMPTALSFTSYEAVCAFVDRSLLLDGSNLYVSLTGGATWHPAGHHDAPTPAWLADTPVLDDLPATAVSAPAPRSAPTTTAARRPGWWRRLSGESDWSHGRGGCRMAALLLLLCVPAGLLLAGYCGWVLASSPAAACLIWPPRRVLSSTWLCSCGVLNSGSRYVCASCGRSR